MVPCIDECSLSDGVDQEREKRKRTRRTWNQAWTSAFRTQCATITPYAHMIDLFNANVLLYSFISTE